jgi:hypothetical protein
MPTEVDVSSRALNEIHKMEDEYAQGYDRF